MKKFQSVFTTVLIQIFLWLILSIVISGYSYILLEMNTSEVEGIFKILNVICFSLLFTASIYFFVLVSTEIIDFNIFTEANISLVEIYFKKIKKEFIIICTIVVVILLIIAYSNNLFFYFIPSIGILILSYFSGGTLFIWNCKVYLLFLIGLIVLSIFNTNSFWYIGFQLFSILYVLKILMLSLFWGVFKLWNISYMRTKKIKEFILYDTIYSLVLNITKKLNLQNSKDIDELVKKELIKSKIKVNTNKNVIKDIEFLLETSSEIPLQKRNRLLVEFRKEIKNIELYRQKRTEIIKNKNFRNLLFAIVMSILSIGVFFWFNSIDEFTKWKFSILLTLTMYLFLTFVTRSYEICKSFYDDIIDKHQKKSNLSKYNRITLAMKSLIEIALIGWCIRIFCIILSVEKIPFLDDTFLKDYPIPFQSSNEEINGNSLILEFFNSISISMFNISYEFTEWTLLGIVIALTHIIQIGTSLVLITLCLTNYFGSKNFVGYYFIVEEKNVIELSYAIISGKGIVEKKLIEKAYATSIKEQLLELSRKIRLKWQQNLISNEEFDEINNFIEEYISSPPDIVAQQRELIKI